MSIKLNHSKNIEYIKKIAVLFASFVMIIICSNISTLKYIGLYIIVISIMYMVEVRKNILTLIVSAFLAWFNYSIVYANYFSKMENFFLGDAYSEESITGMRVLCCFITVIYILTNYQSISDSKDKHIDFSYSGEASSVIAFGYIIILLLIMIYGFARPTVSGERGSPSSIYEYSISFFIVGYYYFRNNKIYIVVSSCLLFLFALQNLVYGGRITALQVIIIFYILFINKSLILDYKKAVPICCIGIVLFTTIGLKRASFEFSSEQIINTINSIKNTGLTLDTSYAAYYCSLTFIKTENILPFSRRIIIFFNWIASQIMGGSLVPNSNVAMITRQYFVHYFGGVLPFFGHFHFGYLGVIIFSSLPLLYISKIGRFNDASGLVKCILLQFVVTTPRWYLYSPSPLVRGVLLTVILFKVSEIVNKILKKQNK